MVARIVLQRTMAGWCWSSRTSFECRISRSTLAEHLSDHPAVPPCFLVLRLVNCPYVFPQFGCCCWAVQSKMVCMFGGEVNTNYYKLFPGHLHLTLLGRVRWWWTDGSQDAVFWWALWLFPIVWFNYEDWIAGLMSILVPRGTRTLQQYHAICCLFPSTTTSSNLTTHFDLAGAHLPLGCKGGR